MTGLPGRAECPVDELDRIRREITEHPSNAWATDLGWEPLFAGSARARVLVIGQAPGRVAQETGQPWSDVSGRLLRSWLGVTEATFYDPDQFALLPMDFYYPGKGSSGDLPPRPDVAPLWHPRILSALTEVRLTVLVGAYSQRYYLRGQKRQSVTETVRAAESFLPFFPLVHPSPLARGWRSRNPWFEQTTVPRLRQEVQRALSVD
ncbi:uracil-DNA glycosylase family protein [Agreia sp. Leaf244]|uniref:uracil-DNA glycosylase family protein n=1 Tax=Agreia sp. Leaf244 TaxID=1736305 RepID=UPI000A62CC55|nr:uracil-DNA glycosylase family protein [Agreia sp. Leaf244]